MEKKYLVKFNWTFQVGPEDWDIESVEKLFDETATIKDIKDWVNGRLKSLKVTDRLIEVKLSEPE